MKILIAVNTCHLRPYVTRAVAQRQTWVPLLRAMGHDVVFFRGKVPTALCNPALGYPDRPAEDEVWFHDLDDGYAGICQKVQRICCWAKDMGYDYVLKVDDDVYIVPQRFQWLDLAGQDYVGRFRGPYGNYPPHFASGFAYWLSETACRIVASTPHNGDWMDERFVASALAHRGIFGHADEQNYCVTGPHLGSREVLGHPVLGKGTIFCEYGASAMLAMHATFRDAPAIWPQPALKPVPRMAVSAKELHAAPTDKIPEGKVDKWKYC